MTTYSCECGMGVSGLNCSKCGSELNYELVTKPDGSTVGVSICPTGCGKIKSPMCCGSDMVASHNHD